MPEEAKLDGKLHKLAVKVKARAEAGRERKFVVRARQGYIAGRGTTGEGPKGG